MSLGFYISVIADADLTAKAAGNRAITEQVVRQQLLAGISQPFKQIRQ
jgi:hypothetical protein